jgi:hypothetical protein
MHRSLPLKQHDDRTFWEFALSQIPSRYAGSSTCDAGNCQLTRQRRMRRKRPLVGSIDIGNLAAFLVSDAARRITDTVIPVDAGEHLTAKTAYNQVPSPSTGQHADRFSRNRFNASRLT